LIRDIENLRPGLLATKLVTKLKLIHISGVHLENQAVYGHLKPATVLPLGMFLYFPVRGNIDSNFRAERALWAI
jgi:hypothetical protein